MENQSNNYAHIKGWGVDADELNDPTYPMRRLTGKEQEGMTWERPESQARQEEILMSIERPELPSVHGTSVPPSGLSGKIRRKAFEYSESNYAHWLPLLIADRINVIEGIIDDFRHGHIPNILAEKGWNARWKHDKAGLLKTGLLWLSVGVLVTYVLSKKKKK